MEEERRGAVIIVSAPTGDVRAAKGLIGRAVRKALRVRRWYEEPHFVSYHSTAEMGDGLDPRFTFDVTNAEMDRVQVEIASAAKAEGWSRPPTDSYHD